jgi:hypothetical protein
MPACRQCGKDNPEGTAFCGHCATPLPKSDVDPVAPTPGANPGQTAPMRGSSASAKPARPEIRTPTFHAPPPPSKGKGGFEWIPWSELSGAQRAGRSIAIVLVLLVFITLVRFALSSLAGGHGASSVAPSAGGGGAPITEDDRKDGVESLCKVFQIYGLPANDHDATEAAKNAGELFKLAGNQSPERSAYILSTLVGEFRDGKLGKSDCEAAGAPLPAHVDTLGGGSPDANPGTGTNP